MHARILPISMALILTLGLQLPAPTATAQMIPLIDNRIDHAKATYLGVTTEQEHTPASFAYFNDLINALAEKFEPCDPPVPPPDDQCLVGQAQATSYQVSQFFPGGIQFSGATGGSWGIPPSGSYGAASISAFTFRVDTPFEYQLFADVDRGDAPLDMWGGVKLYEGFLGGLVIYQHESGVLNVTGCLGPGTYSLHGYSNAVSTLESFQGTIYSAQWTIQPVLDPIIIQQPDDHICGCGGTATFSVGTAGPPANYTYQWRRNLVPLTNNAHVAGATSAALVINSVCDADTGGYDVVVTGTPPGGGPAPTGAPAQSVNRSASVSRSASIQAATRAEPSRLARLDIVSTVTGVATPERPGAVVVRAASPNPFTGATSVRYEAPRAGRLRAAVYSVTGARLRTIADRGAASASGEVIWDGRLQSGAHAPKGIYFIQVEFDGARETRKVVLSR